MPPPMLSHLAWMSPNCRRQFGIGCCEICRVLSAEARDESEKPGDRAGRDAGDASELALLGVADGLDTLADPSEPVEGVRILLRPAG